MTGPSARTLRGLHSSHEGRHRLGGWGHGSTGARCDRAERPANAVVGGGAGQASAGDVFGVEVTDFLTASEIQAGRWAYESQIAPGRYYVMLLAAPDVDACLISDQGDYDPSCADGHSAVLPLTVPRPASRYTASARVRRSLQRVDLRLRVAPLGFGRRGGARGGPRLRYRVCYQLTNQQRRCLTSAVEGFDWNSGASDMLSVTTRRLPPLTTFTWLVGGKAVATRRVRI